VYIYMSAVLSSSLLSMRLTAHTDRKCIHIHAETDLIKM
jgi:hypothetical protein